MSIINWFKQLFNKQQDAPAESLHDVVSDDQGNPIDKEAAYQRILSIVTHLFETMGLGKCFTITRSETGIQLTLANLAGVTRIVNFNSAEELYASVYGLHLGQDLFHVKQAPENQQWAQEALLKPEERNAYNNLQEVHHRLVKDFESLSHRNKLIHQESLNNYNRRCVAENFVQVFRKHVRAQNEQLREINTLVTNATKKGEISTHILDTISERLVNVQIALQRDTKWALLTEKYLVDRGEPAKDQETEPQ